MATKEADPRWLAVLAQPDSPLLDLPKELRIEIWKYTFSDSHIIPSSFGRLRHNHCQACIDIANGNSGPLLWRRTFRPLRTSKQIYNEAHEMLMQSFTLHLGTPLGSPMRALIPWLASMNEHIKRLEWRVHMLAHNRMDWLASIAIIGAQFPNLEKLVIHAHMHAPERLDYRLFDSLYFALPIVRLKQRMPNLKLDFDLAYKSPVSTITSTSLGQITAADALKQHEEMIKDLVVDGVFVAPVLAQDLDRAAMERALFRCARVRGQIE
ncbi:hypothetical protein H2200_011710 [Cladophialophora chaetospira]|uniref:Uncharacterized protein n=1 Tax=Cladophialophora chaetospira TaxID=386627 RepID=A0AA38WYJ5_9EURO|nr:hypothetical protein H2200_011710 [Cladophialophora chaetospira]